MHSEIYLDNSILARPSSHLINQMSPYLSEYWHNVSAPYLKGKEPFNSIHRTFRDLYSFIGAHEKDQFVFTSSGAEAIAQIFLSAYIEHIAHNGKNHILTNISEETPIIHSAKRLENLGCIMKNIPLNGNGQVTREHLENTLSPRTGLVSLSWANPLTGVINPIWELAELCDEKGVLLHVDASAILGKLYFKLQDIPIDYLTFEGTLLHGPKGSGGAFINRFTQFDSFIPEQMVGAQLNTAPLIGLGVAFEEMSESFDHLCLETVRLRDSFESAIIKGIPDAYVLFQEAERLPHISAISFPGVCNELLAFYLCKEGVLVSFGNRRAQKVSPPFQLGNIDPLVDQSTLTFSMSRDTTEKEIQRATGIIIDCAQKCRTYSDKVMT